MYFGNFYNPLDDLAELYKSYDQVVRVPAKQGKTKFTKKRVYRKISKSSFRYNPLESLANLYDIPHTCTDKSDEDLDYGKVHQLSFIMESPERESPKSEHDPVEGPDDYSWQGAEPTDDTSGMWRDSGEPDETDDMSEYVPSRHQVQVAFRTRAKSSEFANDAGKKQKRNPVTRFRVKDSPKNEPDVAYLKRKEAAHTALEVLLNKLKKDGELGKLKDIALEFEKHGKHDKSFLPRDATTILLQQLRGFSSPKLHTMKLLDEAVHQVESLIFLKKRWDSAKEIADLPSLPSDPSS